MGESVTSIQTKGQVLQPRSCSPPPHQQQKGKLPVAVGPGGWAFCCGREMKGGTAFPQADPERNLGSGAGSGCFRNHIILQTTRPGRVGKMLPLHPSRGGVPAVVYRVCAGVPKAAGVWWCVAQAPRASLDRQDNPEHFPLLPRLTPQPPKKCWPFSPFSEN